MKFWNLGTKNSQIFVQKLKCWKLWNCFYSWRNVSRLDETQHFLLTWRNVSSLGETQNFFTIPNCFLARPLPPATTTSRWHFPRHCKNAPWKDLMAKSVPISSLQQMTWDLQIHSFRLKQERGTHITFTEFYLASRGRSHWSWWHWKDFTKYRKRVLTDGEKFDLCNLLCESAILSNFWFFSPGVWFLPIS